MATEDQVADALLENALGPRAVTGDQISVQQHSLPDQIAAIKFARGVQARSNSSGVGFGVRKLGMPAAVSEQ